MDRLKKKATIAAASALLAAAIGGLVVANVYVSRGPLAAEAKQVQAARIAEMTLKQRFAVLSQRHTNKCSLASVDLNKLAVGGRLQGSCCEPMVYSHYAKQIRGLRAYAGVNEIPADPYDVPVALARRLIDYDRSISLSRPQQAIYDHATKFANEHGPCCCHCWRWAAFKGQAKELISQRRYSAAEIARVWDLEDGCGGA